MTKDYKLLDSTKQELENLFQSLIQKVFKGQLL